MERPELSTEDLAISDAEWIDETDDESESEWEPTESDEEFIDDDLCDSDWEVEPVVLNVTVNLPSRPPSSAQQTHRA